MLADDPGAEPNGFIVYTRTARSTEALGNINQDSVTDVPAPIEVPDAIVAQAQ